VQPLNGVPWRSQYSVAQITALLTSPAVSLSYGLELLDQNNNLTEDVSDNLVSWSLTRTNTNTIQGVGTFVITMAVQGGSQRVRPYVLMSGAGLTNVRFDEGVYVLTSPATQLNLTPLTYTIQGSDLLYLLSLPIGDSYTVPAGTGYLAAVQEAIAAAGISGSQVILDQTAAGSVLPADMSWPLTDGNADTYLDVVSQLLAAINYLPIWADWEGNFQSSPYIAPEGLAPTFTFDLTKNTGVIVSDSRTLTGDLWQAPNVWVYINESVDDPVEGDGIYTYVNQSEGQSSVDVQEREIVSVVYGTYPDQPTMEGVAAQAIDQAIQLTATLAVTVSPFPAAWHFDVFEYIDTPMGGPVVVQSQGWSLASDGSDGAQTWQVV
jgi:hypothetical protein